MTLEEQQLQAFSDRISEKKLIRINERILYFKSYGNSNAIAIIGDRSVIMVDAMDCTAYTKELLKDLKTVTEKPVETLIYTHSHPDHRGGAAAMKDTVKTVIMHEPVSVPMQGYERINPWLWKRTTYQFGASLSTEELIVEGLGVRSGFFKGLGPYEVLPPTMLLKERRTELTIDGVRLQIVSAPGETDDTVYVYLPEDGVLCCGDNYYPCWPNIYAIRGTQYRNVNLWIESLSEIIAQEADALLPGHGSPVIGREAIRETLTVYRDAIRYVLDATLNCMAKGMTLEETVQTVDLPENYRRDFLGEYYGTVSFAVRAIYQGYVGWFDGDPVNLLPAPKAEMNSILQELISKEAFDRKIAELLKGERYQQVLELLAIYPDEALKKECLYKRASQTTSANARHYLMESAKAMNGED